MPIGHGVCRSVGQSRGENPGRYELREWQTPRFAVGNAADPIPPRKIPPLGPGATVPQTDTGEQG